MSALGPRQTNLINASLRPATDFLPPERMALAMGGLLLIVSVACAAVFWISSARQERVYLIKGRVAQMREQLLKVSPSLLVEHKEIEAKIENVEREIKLSRELLSALGRGGQLGGLVLPEKTGQHADVLKALARFEGKSLWLTRIEFDPITRAMGLAGKTSSTDDLASYAQFVSSQQEFSGMTFGQLNIHLDSDNSKVWVFSIGAQKSTSPSAGTPVGSSK